MIKENARRVTTDATIALIQIWLDCVTGPLCGTTFCRQYFFYLLMELLENDSDEPSGQNHHRQNSLVLRQLIMALPPPSVLAQLPRPLQAATGKTQAGDVYNVADSKKRRRHEVAVAVDGEGLNIYNVSSCVRTVRYGN